MDRKRQFTKAAILTATLGLLTAFTVRITGSLVSPVRAWARQSLARATSSQDPRGAAPQAATAAFRDGLYEGKIAGERGSEPRVSVGRWASQEDRAAYTAGYLHGYDQADADATATHDED
jgi:hypothetical protein